MFPSLDEERERHAWVRAQLKRVPAGKKILDAGAGECIYKGDCQHLRYVSQDFCQYDGKGNGRGLQRKQWQHPRIDIVCDIEQLTVKSKTFDVVLCTEVLEHIPHPERVIAEFRRVLKFGGVLIMTAPFCSQTHFAPYHYSTGFSKYWYEKVLSENGFSINSMTSIGDYYTCQRTEALRTPSITRTYGKIPGLWICTILPSALAVIYYTLLSKLTKGSKEQLTNTYCVVAKR
jgi:SAM-dependent methyltransferase